MISSNERRLVGFVLTIVLLKAAPLSAQALQVGGKAELAYIIVEDDDGGIFASAGVEACARCSDRFGLFAEYSHWARPQRSPTKTLRALDIGGGGLRIHSRNPSGGVRQFFDLGVGGAQLRGVSTGPALICESRGDQLYCSPDPTRTETSRYTTAHFGFIFGAGAIVPIGNRWYLRPQFRGYWMGIYSLTLSGGLGVGLRL